MANVPQDVIEDQWCRMVSEWCTEKSNKLCEANTANSRKQKNAHTSGRKSHARRRKEMEKEYGKEPDRLTFWEVVHKKKTGEFVDSDTERKVNAACKELDGVVSQGIEPTSELIEELFTKHIGPERNGRMKGLGLGPTLTSYYRLNCWGLPSNNQASSSDERLREVDKLKGEMKGLQKEVERLQALISKKFPEENLGSPSPTSGPSINLQVVDHGSANCSSSNNRSSNSSYEPQTNLHGRTV
ncbi:uncharacterized protein LOC109711645 [Ananas comosus]|uniref:Uncharacterized protein LOC109711645 n=1 Tax=Ananas comosus TaxID=4615 RepID=A0A6P5F352_ANACO|nr:uncharacterized protein LOC109711645 [Ananas comosus]